MCAINTVPSLWMEGHPLYSPNNTYESGAIVPVASNMYFTLLYIFLTFTSIVLPFVLKLKHLNAWAWFIFAGWHFASVVYNVLNFFYEPIENHVMDFLSYERWVFAVGIALAAALSREIWLVEKKSYE